MTRPGDGSVLLGGLVAYLVGDSLHALSSWLWFLVIVCAWLAYRIEPDPQRR